MLLGQTPVKVKAVPGAYFPGLDSEANNNDNGIATNGFPEACNTYTYKMKLMAPPGEKVSLVSFLYLPSNNILILSNTYNINGQANGWMTVLKNDGSILSHQKLMLENNSSVEFFEGNTNLSGKITLTGKVMGGSNQYFVTLLNATNLSAIWTRKFTHSNTVNETAIGVFADKMISFAARAGNEVQFGVLNEQGNTVWSRTFTNPSLKKLVGIEGTYTGNSPIIIALNLVEANKRKLLLVEHESSDGQFRATHFIGNNADEYTGTDLKSFNERIILSGNYKEASSNTHKLFRHLYFYTKTAEVVHAYNGLTAINDSTKVVMSVAGEWLSWIADKQEAVSFIRHAAYYLINPERGGTIAVPGAKEVKAAAAMPDGGYLMGINLKDQSAFYLVKTDSTGRMAECSTQSFNPDSKEVLEAVNVVANYSTIAKTIPSVNNSLQNLNGTASTNFDCKGTFCPPAPVADTCLSTFYKIYRSNSYISAFGFTFDLNNDLAIQTGRVTQLAGGVNSVVSTLNLLDHQGKFKRAVRFLHNGQPIDLTIFPLSKKLFLGYFYVAPTAEDSSRYGVTLIDEQLKPVWTRYITTGSPSPFYSGTGYFADGTMDEAGNIYLMGTTLGYMEKPRITIHKFNNQGIGVWTSSIEVDKTNLSSARIKSVGNHLVVIAEGGFRGSISLRVNKITGDPVNAFLYNNSGAGYLYRRSLEWIGDRFLYCGNNANGEILMASFDSTGRPIKMKKVRNSPGSGSISNGNIFAQFKSYSGSNVKEVLFKVDANLNPVFAHAYAMERSRSLSGILANDKNEIIETGKFYYGGVSSYYIDSYIRKYDADGKLGTCTDVHLLNTIADEVIYLEGIPANRVPQFLLNYPVNNITVIEMDEGERVAEILCKSTTDCNAIDIIGKTSVCNLSETLVYETVLNSECTLKPTWLYDSSMVQLLQQEDKKIHLKFKMTGTTLIKSSINQGCNIIYDSIWVNVQKNSSGFSLGADTIICSGGTVTLNAGAGFSSYKWQDGSADSTFKTNKAGTFYVTTTNACQEKFSDTIIIKESILPTLSAGPDSSVCIGNTLQRLASAGFSTYSWKNLSSQSVVSSSSLLAFVVQNNTDFEIVAANTDGCMRYDTLSIKVKAARNFSLGSNQNICAGDSITFSAPSGYKNYTWNTGSVTNTISVWQQGQYILVVTDTNNCSTADTVLISTVFSLPQPNLGTNKSVCAGSSLLLNPGTFARYQWNDGSTQSTANASLNGSYSVQVWDNNGCTAIDTMEIVAQLPLPTGFLPESNNLCQYEKLTLQANSTFQNYQWSTGSNSATIQVDKPGNYTLRVTNNNNCTGIDTIQVIQKSCMEGVYIPNAFTPNNDGLNDLFRPMVFGKIIHFEFSIFNRYGERMFVTTDATQGWNGMHKGQPMPTNTYIWMCSYQLEGGTTKVEKGTVALIR